VTLPVRLRHILPPSVFGLVLAAALPTTTIARAQEAPDGPHLRAPEAPEGSLVERCVESNRQAQDLGRQGSLVAAREQLKVCLAASCPSLVRDDCTQRMADLDRAQPSVVFDVEDQQGRDLTEVKVTMDGRPLAERLTGIAIPVDPGEHTFGFEAAGRPPTTVRTTLREGEKDRRERVVLAGMGTGAGAGREADAAADERRRRIQETAALVAAGVALAGALTGGAFALYAKTRSDDANAICPLATCPNSEAVRMNRDAVTAGNAATVALAVGAASAAAAFVLWLTAGPPSAPHASVGAGAGTVLVRAVW
jgi:hypothetical protein